MACPSNTVAREILSISKSAGRPTTPLELMKMTYLAHGWSLALRDKPLTSDSLQAWQYGPVYPNLYHALKQFRASPVQNVPMSVSEQGENCRLSEEDKSLIQSVYNAYKGLNGIQLSTLTHQPNTPWDQAWKEARNARIDNEVIKAHFSDLKGQRAA